jgi:hypothetical protein
MARIRQIRWLSCGTLIAALLLAANFIPAQEAERADDGSVPARGGRRGRGAAGANPGRSALDSNPFETARPGATIEERDQVDTSRNLREVYRANYTPAHSLATTIGQLYRGVPGLILTPESVSNSLLISAPPDRFKELFDTIQKLDRMPKSAAIEVTILDFPDVDVSKEINAREFLGFSEKVRARVNELKKSGQIQKVRRFRMTALSNQFTNLQANGERPAVVQPGGFPGGGGFPQNARGNAARFPSAGTTVQCTARISPDKGVVIELVVHDAPSNRDAQQMPEGVTSQFQGTLSIPPATTVVASEIATETEAGPSRVVILVSADVVEPPPETPLAGGPR